MNNLLEINKPNFFRFFLIIFLSAFITTNSFSIGKNQEKKYFISYSGLRTDFQSVDQIRGDSLFIRKDDLVSIILLDSVAEYHHFKPGKGGKGILIGVVAGTITGTLIGAIAAPSIDNSSFTSTISTVAEKSFSPLAGASIGIIVGGATGFLIGIGQKENLNINFRTYDNNSKRQLIQHLFSQ